MWLPPAPLTPLTRLVNNVLVAVGRVTCITRSENQNSTIAVCPHGHTLLPFRKRRKLARESCTAMLIAYEAARLRVHCRNDSLYRVVYRHAKQVFACPRCTYVQLKANLNKARGLALQNATIPKEILGTFLPRCWRNINGLQILQVTMVGRALPFPTSDVIADAISSARSGFATGHTPALNVPFNHALQLVRRIAVPDGTALKKGRPNVFSTSSCLIYGRSSGGRSACLPQGFKALASSVSGLDTRVELYPEFFRTRVEPGLLRQYDVIAVAERGFKARVVTRSHPSIVCDGHCWRTPLYDRLRRFRAARIPIEESSPNKLLFAYTDGGRRQDYRFYSADLSKATDGISHSAVIRFCEEFGIPDDLVIGFSELDSLVPAKRGVFMGLPISWCILSYMHLAVCYAVDPSGRSFYIKGDDLVSLWTKHQWLQYLEVLEGTGMVLNVAKTFVAERQAWFLEQPYRAVNSGGGIVLLRKPLLSLRRFFPTRESVISSINEARTQVGFPGRGPFNRIVRMLFPSLLWASKRARTNPFLPPSLGGSGLLIPDPDHLVLSLLDQQRVNAALNGIPRFGGNDERATPSSVLSYFKETTHDVRYVPRRSTEDYCPNFEDYFGRMVSRATIRDAERGILPKPPRTRSFLKECERIRKSHRPEGGVPYPVTYRTVYELASELVPLVKSIDQHSQFCDCDAPR
jgi:hypothetical protein